MSEPVTGVLDLRVGDVVEVRSAEEIRATLDGNGMLDGLPFMPEMLRYCGQRLNVYKVAHKLCDTMTGSGMRRMEDAVHLGVRCDGSAHDGCQASCMIYWKHAWLRKVDRGEAEPAVPATPPVPAVPQPGDTSVLLPLLTNATRRPPADDGTEIYRCQATELLRAAPERLPVRDVRQYVTDVSSGNVGLLWTLRAVLVAVYNRIQGASMRVLPTWLRFRGGRRWGYLRGTAQQTPTQQTNLQPGDLVRVRSKAEIAQTLNAALLNRGMGFDGEMGRFCGRTARVSRRVDHIVDERTGRMLQMRHPCVVLEDIVCEGAYNVSCPRAITPYWREIWLEKLDADTR